MPIFVFSIVKNWISFSSSMPFSSGTYVTPTRVSSSSRTHLKSARFQKPSYQFCLNLKRKSQNQSQLSAKKVRENQSQNRRKLKRKHQSKRKNNSFEFFLFYKNCVFYDIISIILVDLKIAVKFCDNISNF